MKLPSGFDLSSIEVFMLTAELGGMTQSASHLRMTQSAVSQTISKLEAALDTRLFDRSMRPLALTPSGKLLFRDGSRLLSAAKGLMREVREGSAQPFDCVTIAMAESLANHLTAPLLQACGNRVQRWRMRSGISLLQHHEFLARKLDMLVTGSSQLEDVEDVEHHPIMEESFIVIAPASYSGLLEGIEYLADQPFIRYSLLSAMGQRIEHQLTRMRLKLPNVLEVDSTMQQLSAVVAGLGWSITTPLCLASHPDLLDQMVIFPMPRAQFRRRIQLVARRGEFGDLPREIAAHARAILRTSRVGALAQHYPWLSSSVEWPEESAALAS
ncbi:LysR family transcriptional regulator [Sphingomonas sp. ZT3P38]|jgi:DNA-binding transcriptional LysR family regulator|uniref:LysR family transcriptional regulator n=1 Tax=Parasphingomonas zepuensis TaxID=3096161 RepID=UPI002FC8B696